MHVRVAMLAVVVFVRGMWLVLRVYACVVVLAVVVVSSQNVAGPNQVVRVLPEMLPVLHFLACVLVLLVLVVDCGMWVVLRVFASVVVLAHMMQNKTKMNALSKPHAQTIEILFFNVKTNSCNKKHEGKHKQRQQE